MPPETLIERIAVLEYQAGNQGKIIEELRLFKESMLLQLADLKNSLNLLTWKVGLVTGLIYIVGNQLVQFALKKLL